MLSRLNLRGASLARRYVSTTQFANPSIEMTTLANGLRIVTDSTPGHFCAMGAYVDAGSRYESPGKTGLSHICDRLAWKSTSKYTGLEMMENLAKLGGNYMCSAQREAIIYQASVFNKDADKMFDAAAQTVRNPKITDQELLETLQTAEYEVGEISMKHDMFLPEVLHAAAYNNNTLGLPLYCPPDRIGHITKKDITKYHQEFFQPQNVVMAMVGVTHDHALKLAQEHFGDWKSVTSTRPDLGTVNYTGGEISLPYQPPLYGNLPELYHMQIGFETSGLLHDDLYALATLQKLLGGGSSFSAGGPGKGMFSRLYTRVLNQYAFVENCMSFNHSYVDSGLFGVTISCSPNAAHVMSQIICFELSKLLETDPSKGGLTEKEVKRAKNQLISSLLMNIESKLAKLEDLGRQIQCQGKLTTIDEMIAKIEKLTVSDLRAVAEKVLTGKVQNKGISSGKPSVVMQGDRAAFGDVEFILQHFGLGKFEGEKLSEPRDFSEPEKTKRFGWF
ncbi:LuxS/MPP-like metallohydrolase [Suhomyces tanzawaensis NRRL Y-17324]|uniref:Alpha-MPP n=1 Tax=Suhomyces tanzawaensis NRRL Y-17324 TaxID=984487 RepID=A0A1E4SQ72_9ASCO|nr:LuxS/MPP-like metallohydrolase [Suhomyces tanzawaensis NRRL Y-17324]ODV81648.1 LuxS/MPP-like metallohydrolase [Suhomyces tanzawaensis NRRL Y-17324]